MNDIGQYAHTGRLYNEIFRIEGVGDGQDGGGKVRFHGTADTTFRQFPDVDILLLI